MAISKTPTEQPFPFQNDVQESTPTRYLNMPTAETLKASGLFGIPLKSSITGQTLSDATLEDFIAKATSLLEHELNIFITPVHFTERHDYDKEIWTQSYAWQKLNNSPILDVDSVQLAFGTGVPLPALVDFPKEFVYVNALEGVIRLVPVLGTATSGFLQSSFSGAQWASLLAAGATQFPGAFLIKYRAGFEKDKVPALIAGLIDKMAALQVLSMIGPLLFPWSSVGISADGLSQSVGNPGPQFLAGRIADLKEQIETEMKAARNYYLKSFIIDYI